MSTVDTVAAPGAYVRFFDAAARRDADVTLALTPAVDDDKPLLVKMDGERVVALGDAAGRAAFATAGYYAVRASILREADAARGDGLSALRGFFGRLLERGYRLDGLMSAVSVDVDRPVDVDAAEAFLRRAAAKVGVVR